MKVRALSFTTVRTICPVTQYHISKELNLQSVLSKPTVKSEISEEN
jgi:hypothetical protein